MPGMILLKQLETVNSLLQEELSEKPRSISEIKIVVIFYKLQACFKLPYIKHMTKHTFCGCVFERTAEMLV